jgi:hypothetical protein
MRPTLVILVGSTLTNNILAIMMMVMTITLDGDDLEMLPFRFCRSQQMQQSYHVNTKHSVMSNNECRECGLERSI